MFDSITSLYNKYSGASASRLVVGVDIRDQTLPFMFEVMDPATGLPADQYVLPINPETYRISHTSRATVTQTLGGVFEDNIGIGIPRIAIAGTFGYLGTNSGGHGKSLHGSPKDGWELFKEIEDIFLRFYARFGTYQPNNKSASQVDLSKPPELRFYNYTDEDYFVVQVNKFDITRSIQRKFLYQYDIQLTVMRRLDEPSMTEDALSEELRILNEPDDVSVGLWATLLNGYSQTYAFMADVINTVQSLQQDLATISTAVGAFRQGTSDFIAAPFGLVTSAINTIDSVIATVSSVTDLPHEFTDLLRGQKRTLLSLSLRPDQFKTSTTATGTVNETGTTVAVTEILTAPLPTGQITSDNNVAMMDTPETTLFDPSLETASEVAASETPINYNDTIATIAYRTLGAATEWKRIALLNDLEPPFIVATIWDAYTPFTQKSTLTEAPVTRTIRTAGLAPLPGEIVIVTDGTNTEAATVESVDSGVVVIDAPLQKEFSAGATITRHERALSVLMPGDKIRIPGDQSSAISITGSSEDFESTAYGIDEELDDAGTQLPDPSGNVATVSGIANLEMQLRHRLMTIRGELASLGHPTYGSYLPLIIGKISTDMWLERAKLEAKITVLEDPRIERVDNVRFTIENTAISIELDTYPIGQTSSTRMSMILT